MASDTGVVAMRLGHDQTWYLAGVALVPLAVAVILIVLAGNGVVDGDRIKYSSDMGHGQWDFSTSFATNLGVIGSALTAIVGVAILPATGKILPSAAFAALSVSFGILVLLAPILYNGSATAVEVHNSDGSSACEFHGKVWAFLLADVVTVWGLLGSFTTAFLAILEIEYAGTLSALVVALTAAVMIVAVLFFFRYAWVSIGGTIKDQLDPNIQADRLSALTTARGLVQPTSGSQLAPPKPEWHIL